MREPSNPTRRSFLETSGLAVGLGTLAGTSTLGAAPASSASTSKKLKIAAISSVYYYLSHAYHIVGRFLEHARIVAFANGAGGTRELVALALSKLPAAAWKVLPVRCVRVCAVQ